MARVPVGRAAGLGPLDDQAAGGPGLPDGQGTGWSGCRAVGARARPISLPSGRQAVGSSSPCTACMSSSTRRVVPIAAMPAATTWL